jgi:hypothetical protein
MVEYVGGFKEGDIVEVTTYKPALGIVSHLGMNPDHSESPWSIQDLYDYVPLISVDLACGGWQAPEMKLANVDLFDWQKLDAKLAECKDPAFSHWALPSASLVQEMRERGMAPSDLPLLEALQRLHLPSQL